MFKTWAELCENFKNTFCIRGATELAEEKLDYLKMGNKTCKEYTNEFNSLKMATKYDD